MNLQHGAFLHELGGREEALWFIKSESDFRDRRLRLYLTRLVWQKKNEYILSMQF